MEDVETVQPPLSRKTESQIFSIYLKNPSETVNTAPFVSFPQETVTSVDTLVSSLSSSETCNIGYSDYNAGESLAKATYLYPGQGFVLYTDPMYSRTKAEHSLLLLDGNARLFDRENHRTFCDATNI